MNGNIYKSAGITIGILVGLILAVALILIANNNRKFKTEYDERQLRVRGDAYRYAFYSVIICEVILLILAIGEFTLPIPEYVLHFGGILIGCLVLSGYCIWKDAYWGLNNNLKRYAVVFLATAALNAIPLISSVKSGGKLDLMDGPILNLICLVMLGVLGLEFLVKYLKDKDGAEE